MSTAKPSGLDSTVNRDRFRGQLPMGKPPHRPVYMVNCHASAQVNSPPQD